MVDIPVYLGDIKGKFGKMFVVNYKGTLCRIQTKREDSVYDNAH